MEIILLEKVNKLGDIGQTVKVNQDMQETSFSLIKWQFVLLLKI